MEFFNQYVSNTLAGSGNQFFYINSDENEICKSRTLYKVFCGGEYNYSFLFSNIIDSTFADGSFSRKNRIMDSWKIHEMNVGITDFCDMFSMHEPASWKQVTFDGKAEKNVNPGEFFHTDSLKLSPGKGDYICIEIVFSGKTIPYHEESIIPSFVFKNGAWTPSKLHPFVSMVGCDRKVEKKVAFFGDSITQGCGTKENAYAHWNSVAAENIGERFAYWNLGLGYGRAEDAASNGAWMFKAKQNDIVFVCFGVNDIICGFPEEAIKQNLNDIIHILNENKIQVILQTIPPFDYQGERITVWNNLNHYIKSELSQKVLAVFDCVPLLAEDASASHLAKYGGHPNEIGCKIWGDAISGNIRSLL